MNILVVGGYGVFGERLARLLVRDGHEVTVAGRNLSKAQTLAKEIGCAALKMDRRRDLHLLSGYDVVIDAAGPFHSYGDDPYHLARAAIAAGVHYLDLADNADFCAGIAELDDAAQKAGVCVISGLSSVPALSSAAVRALAGTDTPRVIETAILAGNRSPRGLSVMTSILSQAGRPMSVWRGNRWMQAAGWSDPKTYRLPQGLTRQGWQIEVPDQRLFPKHFGAESVVFRAGLELAIMRYGLAVFARLRRVIPFEVTRPVVKAFKLAADMLAPFGSGRGGMSVMIIAANQRRWWRLLAEDGDGPFIPTVAARALLRRGSLPTGARPALEAITLDEAEAAMSDLNVRTEKMCEPFTPIFPRVLKQEFKDLPEPIRITHLTADVSYWEGQASVDRGSTVWSRLLGWVFGFPKAGLGIPVDVIKTATPTGETWQRRFGSYVFRSHLAATPDGMSERFGPFTFQLGLTVKDGELHYPVCSGRLGIIPLPSWLLPASQTREFVSDGRFNFDVKLLTP